MENITYGFVVSVILLACLCSLKNIMGTCIHFHVLDIQAAFQHGKGSIGLKNTNITLQPKCKFQIYFPLTLYV